MNQTGDSLDAKRSKLRDLWRRIDAGESTPQDRVDALTLLGGLKDLSFVAKVLTLTSDDDDLVRYFALQTLVLDLGVKTSDVAGICWRFLTDDPDEDVRAMSAACLGSIFFGTRRLDVFRRLKDALQNRFLPSVVGGAIYDALFKLAGRSPTEWPGLVEPRRVFQARDVDWRKIDELEESVRAAVSSTH